MTRTISRNQLQEKRAGANPPVVVEALPRRYYDDAHLPGALHMPHDEVEKLAAELFPDRDTEIVVYCASASCRNSHIAATALEKLGYRNVAVYAGGKQDWAEAGLPLEQGALTA